MPPRKKPAPRKTAAKKAAPSRKPTAAKKAAPRRAKTRALAIADAVVREDPRRSLLDSQLAVIEAILAWSPARLLANQQAAFWQGFAGRANAAPRERGKRAAKRAD